MLTENQNKNQCCGCMTCSHICPKSAITMEQDEQGFAYPSVDKNKCIDCGLCHKVCPMEENYVGQDAVPDIYALCNKNQETLTESSSGGMFSILARWVIGQGGVIYGVAFDESFSVRHMRADSMEDAARFRSSKYVESDLTEVYAHILEDLKAGLTVLLTGTPCQISAVQKFLLQKRADCTNLYTCDNICHGVPSRKIWTDYLNILQDKYMDSNDSITYINMRSKKSGWKERAMEVRLKSGDLDEVTKDFSFNKIFSSLYANRPSCFNCKYTSYKRPSDFTLGDFWNEKSAGITFDVSNGVSEVLVNTEKGRKLFQLIKDQANCQPVSKKAAWQPHLEYAAKAPKNQAQFWEEYNSSPDKEALLRRYLEGTLMTKVIRKASPILQKTGLYSMAGKMYKVLLVKKSNTP